MKFATAFEFEAYGPLNERVTDPAEIKKLFYNGCVVRVVYEAKLYDAGGGGVALYLAKIKKVGDGPRLGGTSEATGIEFGDDDIGDFDPMA